MRWMVILVLALSFGPVGNALAQGKPQVHPEKERLTPRDKQVLSQEVLDKLFGRLHGEKSAKRAKLLAGAIWRLWKRSGSATADVLLRQAERAIVAGHRQTAVSILSAVIDQYPDFAEAWNQRATAYFIIGDYDRSIADIKEVLKREPRHFGALAGLGLIYQQQGKNKKALSAFRRALAIHPHLTDAKRGVKRLSGKVEQDI